MKFKVGSKLVGEDEPCFIIAENGNNHAGSFENALKIIKIAAECGANAVTFQHTPIDSYVIKSFYNDARVAYLKDCELTTEQLMLLKAEANKFRLAFSLNVEDFDHLELALQIGIDFVKLCSGDITNLPMLERCAASKKPIFFSTGSATFDEIQTAFESMRANGLEEWCIYHTNTRYPTPIEEADLTRMNAINEKFGGVMGYCDHTADIIPSVAAVARGAKVIEKHITLNRALRGDDWMVSLEPDEFSTMVRHIRESESALKPLIAKKTSDEDPTRTFKRKSIVSKKAIPKGTIITEELLTYKLPGSGIAPTDYKKLIGKKTSKEIPEDVIIKPDMFEE